MSIILDRRKRPSYSFYKLKGLEMKKISLSVIIIMVILSACSASPTQSPDPTLPPVPTQAPTVEPTATSVPPTPTIEPSPTAIPILFQDDFDGILDAQWQWVRENKKSWSLENNAGWLEIVAGTGGVGSGDISNLLLRPVPEGNFELETKVKFKPVGDYQLAGLLIYESAANFIQFGRAFCDAPNVCAGDGYYMDMTIGGARNPENFGVSAAGSDMVTLRLRKEGNTYTSYISEDEQTWKLIGTYTSEMKPLLIGLVAGQAWSAPQPAQFDYFLIRQLP